MEVQSLSVVVPAKCPNQCPFCVSHMNKENKKFEDTSKSLRVWEIQDRMEFARDNGTNTLMITSTGEALMNMEYVDAILSMNEHLKNPFIWIELQTSGVGLKESIEEYPEVFKEIKTISLSVVDIFHSKNNSNEMRMSEVLDLDELIKFLKDLNFNVRISINLTDIYTFAEPEKIFKRLEELNVDQVTFRVLYKSGEDTKQDKWIDEYKLGDEETKKLFTYIKEKGRPLEILPFGAMKYSLNGISTVIDDDCMNQASKNVMKYLILRPDGKLYSKWDDKGSLIF